MKILLAMYFLRSIKIEGAETLLDALAESLNLLDHKVDLFVPLNKKSSKYRVINYISGNKKINIFQYFKKLSKIVPNYDFVWLCENNPNLSFLINPICKLNKNIFVTFTSPLQSAEDLYKNPFSSQYSKHWLVKNEFWSFFQSFKAKKYIISTQFQKNQLIKFGVAKNKIEVLPFGIRPLRKISKNIARKKLDLPLKRPIIGYLGHLNPIKGVFDLIQALDFLKKDFPDLLLAIAWSGKGNQKKRIDNFIRTHHLEQNVKFYKIVEKNIFLSALDATILPFTSSSIPHPPLVMVEAMSCGSPVISTQVGGLSDIIKESKNGFLAKPHNPQDLALKIKKILADNPLRHKICRQNEKDFLAKYNTDKIVLKIIKLYEKTK